MKLKLIYLLSLLVCAGLIVKAQSDHRPGSPLVFKKIKSNELILERDKKSLELNFSPEVLEAKSWKQINDFSIPVNTLVKLYSEPHSLFLVSKQSIYDLVGCLKKDFCGMERKDDKDSYFDDQNTPGHILLGRNLEILRDILIENPNLKKEIDWEIINDLTDNANEKVQVLAVELLKFQSEQEGRIESLLKITDKYKGNAKANAFVEISNDKSEEERNLFLSSIAKTFSADDPDTVISVIEKLSSMHLTFRETEMVANYLCHFKDNDEDNHNWKMIRFRMEKLGVEMQTICP